MNRFERLAAIDCGEHIEKKNGLSYLSWAWAWDQFKRVFPDSYFTVYETPEGRIYWTDGRTCWVKTGVTLVDTYLVKTGDTMEEREFRLEHIEYLPVMNMRNASIPLDAVTSTDVNKAIQRSLTKAVARHGLGLYIYAGEDLPVDAEQDLKATPADRTPPAGYSTEPPKAAAVSVTPMCEICHKPILPGKTFTAQQIAEGRKNKSGKAMCGTCYESWRKVQAG